MNLRLVIIICMGFFLKYSSVVAQTDSINNSHSRDVKAWVIVSDITYPNGNPLNMNYIKQLTVVSGNKTYVAVITKKGNMLATVSKDGEKTTYTLFPNAKTAQRSFIYGEPGIDLHRTTLLTGNTRKIIGYSCNEIKDDVRATYNGINTDNVTFVYLSDLNGKYTMPYGDNKDLKGLVLGTYVDVSKSWTMANSIEEQQVDSAIFEIPSDYAVVTTLEFTNKLEHDRKFSKQINKDLGISTAGILLDIFKEAIPDILENISNKDISNIVIKQPKPFSQQQPSDNGNGINSGYTNNTYTTSSTRKCGYCSGTGECPYCNRAGQSKACVQNQFGVKCTDSYCIAKNHRCKHCNGTHKCSNCKGTGYCR